VLLPLTRAVFWRFSLGCDDYRGLCVLVQGGVPRSMSYDLLGSLLPGFGSAEDPGPTPPPIAAAASAAAARADAPSFVDSFVPAWPQPADAAGPGLGVGLAADGRSSSSTSGSAGAPGKLPPPHAFDPFPAAAVGPPQQQQPQVASSGRDPLSDLELL
jgi:hypothetical protein